MTDQIDAPQATLYRMVFTDRQCPFGLKAKALLENHNFSVEDKHLKSREETDAFKQQHKVKTTPQIWINDKRIGGYDDLRVHLGYADLRNQETTYQPIIVLFCISALLALSLTWLLSGTEFTGNTIEWFIAFSMVLLGLQKLQDVESFTTSFLNYDLLAQRWVRYAYIYPFAETAAGLLMLAGVFLWLAAPIALFIGTIGALSVYKAVYIDKRDLKCACTGGNSNVPLGFVSLTENLIMMVIGIWMLVKITFF